MNCLDFRRQLGSEPLSAAADFLRHRHECARCAEAAARAGEFEGTLRRALQVPVPPQLAESILLRQATQQNRRQTFVRRGSLFALAAMLVLAVGVGMRVEAKPLTLQAVDHLIAESVVLTSSQPVDAAAVRAAFAQRGLALHDVPPAVITFIGCCPMGRHRTVHLVMREDREPVTVIYVVDQASAQREDFQRDGWRGRAVAVGAGTLILLARDADHFDAVENLWRQALGG
jgi:hypothetical protein